MDFSTFGESFADVFDSFERSACISGVQLHQVRQMPAALLPRFPVLDNRE